MRKQSIMHMPTSTIGVIYLALKVGIDAIQVHGSSLGMLDFDTTMLIVLMGSAVHVK
jgi:hypothetical protein